jgi:hypothetical protein
VNHNFSVETKIRWTWKRGAGCIKQSDRAPNIVISVVILRIAGIGEYKREIPHKFTQGYIQDKDVEVFDEHYIKHWYIREQRIM